MTGWGGATPLRGRSEPPRHDGVRQHPSSPGLRNNRGFELGLDPAGACAEFRDDAARPTRAGALEGDPRAASASDVCLRLSALRPVTAERRASRATGSWHRRWGTRLRPRAVEQLATSTRNLDSTGAAAGGPDTQRTPF